jgi:undecaprenyl diphosphate synthase
MNHEPKTIPSHIAIIMDGNRRWAKERNLPALEGHRRVVDHILEPLIEHASVCGIQYLTLWAWSTENWKRDSSEVKGIMNLLRYGFGTFGDRMHANGIRIQVIGNTTEFDPDIQELLNRYVEKTKANTKITVTFALNYGGRDEILRAVNTLHKNTNTETQNTKITEETFSQMLDTANTPDPDMIVRTGGEKRLSGFLLWQSQYSELFFEDWYMPDFTPDKLDNLLMEFSKRQRRFGA